jgi:hypothetical protein
LNDGQIPNFHGVRVHVSTGYNRVEGNRRASRNDLVSDLPPETPDVTIRVVHRWLQVQKGRHVSVYYAATHAAHARPMLEVVGHRTLAALQTTLAGAPRVLVWLQACGAVGARLRWRRHLSRRRARWHHCVGTARGHLVDSSGVWGAGSVGARGLGVDVPGGGGGAGTCGGGRSPPASRHRGDRGAGGSPRLSILRTLLKSLLNLKCPVEIPVGF